MFLYWRRRKAVLRTNVKSKGLPDENSVMEIVIPSHFQCPISMDLMKDPVTLCTGITYDRESIERWIDAGNNTCPVTNQILTSFDQIPNHTLRKMIQSWCVQNHSYGIQRIPTPRIPITKYEISELCSSITVATQEGDHKKCMALVGKIRTWGRESEHNKRCMVGNGTGSVLAACFEYFSNSIEKHVELLEEILLVLSWMFPIDEEGQLKLGSQTSVRCIVSFLKRKDLSARQNAVLVLKELLAMDQKRVDKFSQIEGVAEALVNIFSESLCPAATKASLMAIFYMVLPSKTSEKTALKFVELGLVSWLLDFIVGGEKFLCQRALGVLDGICDSKQGREEVYENALTIPLLVKMMLRVSDLATEFSVSILWKLLKNGKGHDQEDIIIEALQVGAFQKLLVILQVGCSENLKERVNGLLKLFNLYRGRLNCLDSSMDLKYLKRPF